MQCPKDKTGELVSHPLADGPMAHHCPDCGGNWISGKIYEAWQEQQPVEVRQALPTLAEVAFEQPPLDTRAAFCPECRYYLTRTKVGQKYSFFVERCPNCNGIWCDRGEWEVLQKLGLHGCIDQFFTSDWQARLKEREYAQRERQATIEKLGEELAQQVFALAEQLEKHPNGDFGVAYLMRRFDQ
ncbi:MAG: zf-TFIIB domain-containing protein [Elainellaceae cyanobacterium]